MPPSTDLLRRLTSPYVLMLLPILFWAGNAIIGRASVGEIPPFALSFWRWVVALVILLPFGLPRVMAQRARIRRRLGLLVVLAVTSVAAYNTLLYLALQTTSAINAILLAAAMPIMIVVLSWLWLGEAIGWKRGVGVLVSLAGVLAVVARGDMAVLAALQLQTGDAWMLMAVLSWAVYSVLLRRHPAGLDPVALLTVLVALGVPCILPFYLWELSQGQVWQPTAETLAIIAYVGIFPSVLAYYFWNEGVAALGANTAGQYTYLMPVFTAILAVIFLDESFRWFHAAGLGLIFFGIWLATPRPR
jgi:drug/metabolite transporter (DMT)-like permease